MRKKKDKNKNKPEVEAKVDLKQKTEMTIATRTRINEQAAKRKKVKKITRIVTGVTGILVAIFVVIAFAGVVPGSFVINLKQSKASLGLSRTNSFQETTTMLIVNKTPKFGLYNAEFVDDFGHQQIDSEDTDSSIGVVSSVTPEGEVVQETKFFKYTFFIKNISNELATYSFEMRITHHERPKNVKYSYDDFIRIRLYENQGQDETVHNYTTYAKKTATRDADPDADLREYLYLGSEEKCEMFVDNTVIMRKVVPLLNPGEVKRYTVCTWLEIYDPDIYEKDAPHGGSLLIGVNIHGDAISEDKEAE